MVVHQFLGCFGLSFKVLLGYDGFEEFLYKGNDEVFGGNAVKIFQNPCFCFGHHCSKLSDSNFRIN